MQSFPKTKRIENQTAIDDVKSMRCLVCDKAPPNDAHHVTTVKAGGNDEPSNLMNLCRSHHQEIHKFGYGKMIEIYSVVGTWLKVNNRDDILDRIERAAL